MILVSGANRHDSKMFERCVDAIPALAGLSGRPRKRPAKLHADKGYDFVSGCFEYAIDAQIEESSLAHPVSLLNPRKRRPDGIPLAIDTRPDKP